MTWRASRWAGPSSFPLVGAARPAPALVLSSRETRALCSRSAIEPFRTGH
ncbi:hypothetical protein HMPREF1549_02156 [Actinomyces johnsonii F0510]|uniref:Uncharacterized protein n=1 Tax=Actinomyces johnsonii F0510 TaxID=1227262 RepID=U1PPF1_9ACTO|nr:hypothetical protein HMPREF1549_02156 [Actinomyces johnsonii F0510]